MGVIRTRVLSRRFGEVICVWPRTKCTTAAYIFGLLSVMSIVDDTNVIWRDKWRLPRADEERLETGGLVVEREIQLFFWDTSYVDLEVLLFFDRKEGIVGIVREHGVVMVLDDRHQKRV